MGKIIIENRSSVSDLIAIKAVISVINGGRVSNDGKQYCYYTTSRHHSSEYYIGIASYLNKKSDRFVVVDQN